MNTDHITVNTQSSIRIAGSKVLYFDPFQISEPAHDADLIFVTHSHYDHLDPDAIAQIAKPDTIFVAPATIQAELAPAAGSRQVVFLNPGDTQDIGGIHIQAVPAYNPAKPFHPQKNAWVGYIVTMDGATYYVAGDTDAVPELREVKCDIAFVPIGGKYTMTAQEAAGLVTAIHPAVAIPTHYGSIVGKKDDADTFRANVDGNVEVVLKL